MHKILLDVEGLVQRARNDLEKLGLRMPPMLRDVIRGWLTRTYETGVVAQREAFIAELSTTPEGRAALERHKIATLES